eukprot:UN15433
MCLSKNELTGQIPSLPSSLREFEAESNQFTGSLPTSWPSSLEHLNLESTRISGQIPKIPFVDS